MIGIYRFIEKDTNKSYVGQSKDIEKRYKTEKDSDTYFAQLLTERGYDAFNFEIIEECGVNELLEKETFYIHKFNSLYPNGYNQTDNHIGAERDGKAFNLDVPLLTPHALSNKYCIPIKKVAAKQGETLFITYNYLLVGYDNDKEIVRIKTMPELYHYMRDNFHIKSVEFRSFFDKVANGIKFGLEGKILKPF